MSEIYRAFLLLCGLTILAIWILGCSRCSVERRYAFDVGEAFGDHECIKLMDKICPDKVNEEDYAPDSTTTTTTSSTTTTLPTLTTLGGTANEFDKAVEDAAKKTSEELCRQNLVPEELRSSECGGVK